MTAPPPRKQLYAAGRWVSARPFAYGTAGNMARPVNNESGGEAMATTTAAPPLVTPPSQFDPAARTRTTSSANFQASVKRDQAMADANADVQHQREDLLYDANRAAPPQPTGTTQTLTGARPDGTTFTRALPQYAESQQVKDARHLASILTPPPDALAKGKAAFDASLADSRQRFDAANAPPADPKLVVANALAGKYGKEGDAAATRAGNDTTRTQSSVSLNKAHGDYYAKLGEAAKTKATADAHAAIAKGDLDTAMKILTGEKATTEREMRPGKVQGQQVQNQSAADANTRANQRVPFQQYADVTRGLHNSLDPVTGQPVAGAPQPPLVAPPAATPVAVPSTATAGTANPPLVAPPAQANAQPAAAPVQVAVGGGFSALPGTHVNGGVVTANGVQQQPQSPAQSASTAAPRLKVPAGAADNGDGTMTFGGGRYAPANVNGQWHWKRVG